jgi:hypothetical protein
MSTISLALRDIKMPELIVLAGNIYKHMVQHQDLFPNPPVPYEQLQQSIAGLAKAQGEVSARNFTQTVIRNAHAAEVKRILDLMASYVSSIAQGDREIALKAGMPPRKMARWIKPLDEVRIKWVRPGDRKGEIKMMVSRTKMHKSVEVQYTYDPNATDNWQLHAIHTGKIMIIGGLEPLSFVWVRVQGAATHHRNTPWSEPMGVRVPG